MQKIMKYKEKLAEVNIPKYFKDWIKQENPVLSRY